MDAADARFFRVVQFGVAVSAFLQFDDAIFCALLQLIIGPELNRLRWTSRGAGGHQSGLLTVVAEGTFESAPIIEIFINHSKRTRHDAIATAVTNIGLFKD